MIRLRILMGALAVCSGLLTNHANAQLCPNIDDLPTAWVDPVNGIDWNLAIGHQINDPSVPYKTLQKAIDDLQFYVNSIITDPACERNGIVYCMPGVIGPTHPENVYVSSGDDLPIMMRDRIHVVGVGTRRCIIRGLQKDDFPQNQRVNVFWPDAQWGGNFTEPGGFSAQVLVSYAMSTDCDPVAHSSPPAFPVWAGQGDTSEMLRGFTLQGGDVQVSFERDVFLPNPKADESAEIEARIVNCCFDLRDQWEIVPGDEDSVVEGPYFGIMMVKSYTDPSGTNLAGYVDQPVLIANNSFIFGEWVDGWTHHSRDEAVGIIDVTGVCPGGSTTRDVNTALRGIGRPAIINNLFRTVPLGEDLPAVFPVAMLGIDFEDGAVDVGGMLINSNAFAPRRVGATNGMFFSQPEDSSDDIGGFIGGCSGAASFDRIDCSDTSGTASGTCIAQSTVCNGAPAIATDVAIWDNDGNVATEFDPLFVGEWLNGITPMDPPYRDWRLVPGSPLQDAGWSPANPADPIAMGNGATYFELPFEEVRTFDDWDGEYYGNPRVFGAAIDIGFDEVGNFIMAGSWANDSNSHNLSSYINPTPMPGSSTRVAIFPPAAASELVTVNGWLRIATMQTPLMPCPEPDAWVSPPPALTPPGMCVTQEGTQMRYINLTNPQQPPNTAPTPWSALENLDIGTGGGNTVTVFPPQVTGQTAVQIAVGSTLDVEPMDPQPCGDAQAQYFNMQAVFHPSGVSGSAFCDSDWLRLSNLQSEYR